MTYSTPYRSGWTYATGQSTTGSVSIPSNSLPSPNRPAVALVSTNAQSVWPRGVHLVNRAENGLAVRFVVDSKPYTLQPGQRLEFAQGSAKVVRFDRGGQFGTAAYQLVPAVFRFTPGAGGWQLFRSPHTAPVVTGASSSVQLPPPVPWPGG